MQNDLWRAAKLILRRAAREADILFFRYPYAN